MIISEFPTTLRLFWSLLCICMPLLVPGKCLDGPWISRAPCQSHSMPTNFILFLLFSLVLGVSCLLSVKFQPIRASVRPQLSPQACKPFTFALDSLMRKNLCQHRWQWFLVYFGIFSIAGIEQKAGAYSFSIIPNWYLLH